MPTNKPCASVIRSYLMLLLNEISLWYFNLSASKETSEPSGLVKDWANLVSNLQSKMKPSATATASSKSSSSTALVFSDARRAQSSKATSVHSKGTKPPKARAASPAVIVIDGAVSGGLFDDWEDAEHEAALSSPVKGHQRLTHQVRFY
jgi:hypothetical protein